MHDESLSTAVTEYLFNDDDMYRRHFVPMQQYMKKNPKDQSRVMELVDNVCMKFSNANKIPYASITPELKKQVAINVYQEMIDDETHRSR
tara:strand:- start:75 stop:344 length:270 start_codon:yes stop_codon:yes gene_type:complete